MSNVHTLNDIKDSEGGSYKKPGQRLGSAYEQVLKKKLRSVTEFNSEIIHGGELGLGHVELIRRRNITPS